jgi:hypothetical protein
MVKAEHPGKVSRAQNQRTGLSALAIEQARADTPVVRIDRGEIIVAAGYWSV